MNTWEIEEILTILSNYECKNVLQLVHNNCSLLLSEKLVKRVNLLTVLNINRDGVNTSGQCLASQSNVNLIAIDGQLTTNLNMEKNFYDLVLSDSILVEMDYDYATRLLEICLSALKINGMFFFRASCIFDTDSISRSCLTKCIDFFQSKIVDIEGIKYGFDLKFARPPRTHEIDKHENLFYFLLTKAKLENFHGFNTLREFLDHKQYSLKGILEYEMIFGSGFISPGGSESTDEFLKYLDLKPEQRVLDVGCGIGGASFMMAEKYGVEVIGLDLSLNSVCIALNRLQNKKNLNVKFEIGDALWHEFPDQYFDAIYSRDTILHISNKSLLFQRLKNLLKPGGKLFISDYCCGPKPWSTEFSEYVDQRGYTLLTPDEYGHLFMMLGYSNVKATDRTDLFLNYLHCELSRFSAIKENFVKEFSVEDYDHLVDSWNEKIKRCHTGDQRWGHFYAEKS